jgi:hypothetical protein
VDAGVNKENLVKQTFNIDGGVKSNSYNGDCFNFVNSYLNSDVVINPSERGNLCIVPDIILQDLGSSLVEIEFKEKIEQMDYNSNVNALTNSDFEVF